MKKIFVALLFLTLSLNTACGKNKEIERLLEQAEQHYTKGEFTSAQTVYAKALDLREDAEVRRMYEAAAKEMNLVEKYDNFIDDLKRSRDTLENVRSTKELVDAGDMLISQIDELMRMNTDKTLRSSVPIRKAQSLTLEFDALKTRAGSAELHKIFGDSYYDYALKLKDDIDKILEELY